MSEVWKPVVGYEDKYEVSNLGQVRSFYKGSRYGSRKRDVPLILTPVINTGGGHLRVKLTKDGKNFNLLVHTLVLQAFVGPCPTGMEGCHNKGDPTDNRLGEIRWDTHKANMQDASRHGTMPRGEAHFKVKLTEEQALKIKTLIGDGVSRRLVAQELGVALHLVENICKGRAWKWLEA